LPTNEITFRRVRIPSPKEASTRLAAITRHHPDAPQSQIDRLRAELAAANLQKHIKSVLDEFPPLTPDQVNTLAAMLLQGGGQQE
jgi:hypothetical protein